MPLASRGGTEKARVRREVEEVLRLRGEEAVVVGVVGAEADTTITWTLIVPLRDQGTEVTVPATGARTARVAGACRGLH